MSHDEVEYEPIPGLPALLPAGEEILWQGKPAWRSLAVNAFHVRKVALYLSTFAVLRGVMVAVDGGSMGEALLASLILAPLVVAAVGVLTVAAWLNAESTVYTLTSRRVVMRFGVAIPISFNLPFTQLKSADLRLDGQGKGDVSLVLADSERLAYLHLWPHARPWHMSRSQPMMRSIPDAEAVGRKLAEAVAAWGQQQATGAAVEKATPVSPDPRKVLRTRRKGAGARPVGGPFQAAGEQS